jgi:hypothetical protein
LFSDEPAEQAYPRLDPVAVDGVYLVWALAIAVAAVAYDAYARRVE